ncbi:sirohydrochlorin cobaltochelatase [Sulfodiicoccus acidiphilus]|uniref:Sirohydrochlorin cobaltochelatase n=1 Tax=Sulfodiicoccus acidiphilus TaxID=1670455 RepID=A0A348B194_9CREN|nr:CbiX/SirB N-terminal domain-containing protein [Sulfodiicoccus acidiphilus]BBD71946.1 sirohydrochlorin cobaltochelatase [Sulfodiicoccus acidiphilus]GGT91664.1 sirohydrochlorin cobaltochelatase [Sulfodiicoccus acidiphilus]
MLGVLLVLHGSRESSWKEVATKYAELLRRDFSIVEYGFIEFNTPTLREAFENLVRKGATEVVAVPLLFAAGAHFKRDVPRLLGVRDGYCEVEGKRVRIAIAEPLGVDERVAGLLAERAKQAIRTPTA